MAPIDYSADVRTDRDDLTNYVVHLTRGRTNPQLSPLWVLIEILSTGFIRPTFAPYGQKPRPGVKGPYPVVCLTEQPISALIRTLKFSTGRYAGYGIAYYKPILYGEGGRPVLYGSDHEIGRKIKEGEPGWEEGKEIFTGGLPPEMQYLWVHYSPADTSVFGYKIDFTWEREWRVKFPNPFSNAGGLPVGIRNPWSSQRGAILVSKEAEVTEIRSCIEKCREGGAKWPEYIGKVISFEKAVKGLNANDRRYGRIETWPDG